MQMYGAPIDDDAKLHVHSAIRSSLPRFERLFHRFWGSVPDDRKAVMVTYWLDPKHRMSEHGPGVFLLYDWAGRAPNCMSTMQDKETGEFRVLIHRRPFNAMPDDIAVILIAHEFAHVYQLATGTLYSHQLLSREEAIELFETEYGEPYPDAQKWMKAAIVEAAIEDIIYRHSKKESEAHQIATSWGFDIHALDLWADEWGQQQ